MSAPVCDFCRAPLTGTWRRFGCHDFTRTVHGDRSAAKVALLGFWGACLPCGQLVEARRWQDLAQRALRHFEKRSGRIPRRQRGVFLSELLGMYLQLEQHLTGDDHEVAAA